ncbi:MAG: hypothetical protein WBA93_18550 [Microcoleaceae cyanobacterium]
MRNAGLAPEERNWVVGRAASLRNPGYELAKTYSADENLLDVLGTSTVDKAGRRLIIYVAIQACSADGEFHPDERANVYKIAEKLGVEKEVVDSIEQICVEEAKMREKRISLYFRSMLLYIQYLLRQKK